MTPNAMAVGKQSATGDNCSIDTDNGLKIPGKVDDKGRCCSVFDSKKCVDIPKEPPKAASAKKVEAKRTATPAPRRPKPAVQQAKDAEPSATAPAR